MNSLLSSTILSFLRLPYRGHGHGPVGGKKGGQFGRLLPRRKKNPLVGGRRLYSVQCFGQSHIVGMMESGLPVGFAQSHPEITHCRLAHALLYFFLPVYRKLNVYT